MIFRVILTLLITIAAAWGQATPDAAKPASSPASTADTAGAGSLASAQALMKKGQYEEAANAFRAIVRNDPSAAEAQIGLVRSLMRSHEIDEAEASAKSAIAAIPSSAPLHAVAGDVAFRLGKFDEAQTEYRAALKVDANSARAWFGLGRMYDAFSMHKSAKNAFTKAHTFDPSDEQIASYWVDTLPYSEQLELTKKSAGEHPKPREAERIKYLTEITQKKPWVLIGGVRPAEIKMVKYGKSFRGTYDANRDPNSQVAKGYALSVKFNDRASADLLLDTGASGIIIGNKLAERAGAVKISDTYIYGFGDQGVVRSYEAWVDKINIGGLEFHDCIVTVSSKNDVNDESGLIGTDVFQRFLITLDFANWKLLLSPLPKNPNATGSEDDPQDRYVAPEMQGFTKFYRFGHDIALPVVVSDKAIGNFILDTGAFANNISIKLASRVTKASADDDFRITGVSGKVSANSVLTAKKVILQFAKMRVESHDLPAMSLDAASRETEISGFIGIRTLTQMKMTIDYRDGLINLEVYEFKKAYE
ncbi:MAG TPA: tetratricopeptide repeat protein [Alphaproteobacteria bacterium]|nr:tetratricopeptide repeat protein [Alphaproteobacteria bacterium]